MIESWREHLLKSRFIGIGDSIIVLTNTLSVLALLWLVLSDFVRSHEGVYMTWIQIEGHGGAWTTYFGIEILPLIALATIFLVTQIYLNLRLIRRNSTEKKDGQN
jgi:hypothetical protein